MIRPFDGMNYRSGRALRQAQDRLFEARSQSPAHPPRSVVERQAA